MKVMLILPPYPKDKIFRKSMKNLGAVLPPLGIAYIASMLEKYGHEVRIIDGPAMATVLGYGFKDLERDIKKFDPDCAGVSALNSQIDHAKKTLKIIKENNKDCITILGGALISAEPEALLDFKDADYGIYGEADLTFPDILEKISKEKKIEGSEGLIWRQGKGVKFLKPKLITNLDDIPLPARHLLKMKIYRPSAANYRRLPATTMMTSRGCPFQCIFCSKPTMGSAFRANSAKRVVDEMEELVTKYKIRDIQIFDDTFTLLPQRTTDICKDIIKRKLDVEWNCMTRADRINEDIAKLMKKSGCYEVGFGIESGSDRVLKFIKKGLNKEQIRQGVRWAKNAKIDIRGFFMMGFPTESKKEVMDTIKFAKELDVDIAQFMVATPFPGTEMWDIAQKHGEINKDWSIFTFYAPDKAPYSSKLLSEKQIVDLYKKANRDFYLRPKFILKQITKIRSFNDINRYWLAAKGILGL